MAKPKKVAYVVFLGHKPGIYPTWVKAEYQVKGYSGAKFKGYYSQQAAQAAWDEWNKGQLSEVEVVPKRVSPQVYAQRQEFKKMLEDRLRPRNFWQLTRRDKG